MSWALRNRLTIVAARFNAVSLQAYHVITSTMFTNVDPVMPSHVASTSTYSAAPPGVRVTLTLPNTSVGAGIVRVTPCAESVSSETIAFSIGSPPKSTVTSISEVSDNVLLTVAGLASTETNPEAIVKDVDCEKVSHRAVIETVPVLVPGANETMTFPWSSVTAAEGVSDPWVGVAVVEKVTVSPAFGLPSTVT